MAGTGCQVKQLTILFLILLLASCHGKQEVFVYSGQHYAQGFAIEEHESYTRVDVRFPGEAKIVQTYILLDKNGEIPSDLPDGILIRTPLERVVSFSALTCGMLDELGVLSSVVGLTEVQYVNIPSIKKRLEEGSIMDLGMPTAPNLEKILDLEPEAIFMNPIPGEDLGYLQKLPYPVIQCLDYKETSPLGQAEWIRFMGLLFDEKGKSDSLFQSTEERYLELKELTAGIENRPCVFTEMKYGDFWYVPGGKSYIAHLLNDAGANYLWKDNDDSGTIHFSFEQVLDKAEDCDFWLIKHYNPSGDMTYSQMQREYANYSLFSSFRNQNIYYCNTGQVPYYEELPMHPDRVLRDMIHIFHPELLPDYELRYYAPMRK